VSDFLAFAQLGFRHIVDVSALDHVLFLLALAAIYRPRDWRDALWVVSAFTVGHSVTLALAVTDVVTMHQGLVEFLIPVTIVATAVENVLARDRAATPRAWRYRPVLAGVFGLVHGAGFAGYLKSLFLADIAVPLLGFNVGIEVAQVVVLAAVAVALAGVDSTLRAAGALRRGRPALPVLRLRVVALSAVVGVVAAAWAVERRPW
jgi:hypothetical protein